MKELVACPMDLSSNMTPENQWLKHDNFLLGWPIFGNYASFRECTVGSLPNIKYSKSPSVHAKNWWDHAKLPDRSIFQCPRKWVKSKQMGYNPNIPHFLKLISHLVTIVPNLLGHPSMKSWLNESHQLRRHHGGGGVVLHESMSKSNSFIRMW